MQVNFITKLLFVLVNLSALLMVVVPLAQSSAAAWQSGELVKGWESAARGVTRRSHRLSLEPSPYCPRADDHLPQAALPLGSRRGDRVSHRRPTVSESLNRLLQALVDYVCFILLFSQIIPISLRVALDMAKLVYKLQMTSDERLPGLQVIAS